MVIVKIKVFFAIQDGSASIVNTIIVCWIYQVPNAIIMVSVVRMEFVSVISILLIIRV